MKRDRRWCQGNLQHLRLLFTEGLFGAHRALFLNGALSYVSALLWFASCCSAPPRRSATRFAEPDYFPRRPEPLPASGRCGGPTGRSSLLGGHRRDPVPAQGAQRGPDLSVRAAAGPVRRRPAPALQRACSRSCCRACWRRSAWSSTAASSHEPDRAARSAWKSQPREDAETSLARGVHAPRRRHPLRERRGAPGSTG